MWLWQVLSRGLLGLSLAMSRLTRLSCSVIVVDVRLSPAELVVMMIEESMWCRVCPILVPLRADLRVLVLMLTLSMDRNAWVNRKLVTACRVMGLMNVLADLLSLLLVRTVWVIPLWIVRNALTFAAIMAMVEGVSLAVRKRSAEEELRVMNLRVGIRGRSPVST